MSWLYHVTSVQGCIHSHRRSRTGDCRDDYLAALAARHRSDRQRNGDRDVSDHPQFSHHHAEHRPREHGFLMKGVFLLGVAI